MSKGLNNQEEENAKAEQSDMNSDKDQENIESSQENSELEADTEVNAKTEDGEETVQGETQDDVEEPADLTKDELSELKKKERQGPVCLKKPGGVLVAGFQSKKSYAI